ncbi:PAS domain-containing sensor histidine kinase [Polyangium mundeleinium]|uniref:histidine kinase n=1 Tax=Polyangium mundeleinium TaxID=2995306 RepID=A0ABT5EP47_9BACT|nr:sensor histidine kinase [Polyangium mundeleinium]MDC0743618.1 PAS domain S-box protein [Polyangium mundeleinium]
MGTGPGPHAMEGSAARDWTRESVAKPFERLYTTALHALEADVLLLYLPNARRALELVAHRGGPPEWPEPLHRIPLTASSLVARVVRDGTTEAADAKAPTAPEDVRMAHTASGVRHFIAAPVDLPGGRTGALVAGFSRPTSPRTRDTFEALAGLAASVLEEKQAQAEAEAKAEAWQFAFQRFFDVAMGSILVANDDGRFVEANAAACSLLGRSREEMLNLSIHEITTAHGNARFEELWRTFLVEGIQSGHFTLVRGDGSTIDVAYHARANVVPGCHVAGFSDVTEQNRAAERIRRDHESLSRAQRVARVGSIDWDIRGNEVRWSEECYRLLGLEPTPTPRTLRDANAILEARMSPEEQARLRAAYEAALKTGRSFSVDIHIRRPDGEERLLHQEADIECDAAGKAVRIVGTLQDVTEQRRAEQALRRSRESLARAQAVAHVGHWEWDAATGESCWSDEVYRIFGLPPRAGPEPHQTLAGVLHPEDRMRILLGFRSLVEKGEPFSCEHRVVRPDGELRIVHVEAMLTRDEAGRPLNVLGVVQDITDLRRAEREREALLRALADERRWLRAVIESSPVGIQLWQGVASPRVTQNRMADLLIGNLVDANPNLDALRSTVTYPDGTPVETGDLSIERALRGEVVVGRELIRRQPNGTSMHTLVNASPVRDESGLIHGAVVLFSDITAIKELSRLREEWTTIVAHDLRQPVTTILATAAHLARYVVEPNTKRKAERIRASAERLIRMTDDLSDLSRLDTHKLELVRTPTNLPALLRQIVEDMADEEARARVWLSIDRDMPLVHVDPARIQQVVENLVSNAVKYGRPGTPIALRLRVVPGEVVLGVCNEGPGIDPELMPRLFSRFQRGSAGATRIKGLGLGLYICRGLVEAHGGRMMVESEPDKTTTFSFTLPIDEGGSPDHD